MYNQEEEAHGLRIAEKRQAMFMFGRQHSGNTLLRGLLSILRGVPVAMQPCLNDVSCLTMSSPLANYCYKFCTIGSPRGYSFNRRYSDISHKYQEAVGPMMPLPSSFHFFASHVIDENNWTWGMRDSMFAFDTVSEWEGRIRKEMTVLNIRGWASGLIHLVRAPVGNIMSDFQKYLLHDATKASMTPGLRRVYFRMWRTVNSGAHGGLFSPEA